VNELALFQRRLEELFGPRESCFTLPGFASVALQFLQSEIHVVKKRGKTLAAFGGPDSVTPAIRAACLSRMRAWLQLCRHVIAAEFPDFEVVHAFWIFLGLRNPASEVHD